MIGSTDMKKELFDLWIGVCETILEDARKITFHFMIKKVYPTRQTKQNQFGAAT